MHFCASYCVPFLISYSMNFEAAVGAKQLKSCVPKQKILAHCKLSFYAKYCICVVEYVFLNLLPYC